MGKGGQQQHEEATKVTSVAPPTHRIHDKDVWVSSYFPLDKDAPELPSKKEMKNVIPEHCFKRSYMHSMMYVARDSIMAAALVYATSQVLSTDVPENFLSVNALGWVAGWNFYAFWMGTILTGHWVLAHECGHGAFSPSQNFNDFWGFIMHQALLVPYFAWQYTHAKHHRRTNNLVDGESHVPTTGKENGLGPNNERESFYAILHDAMGDGAFAAFQVYTHLFIGWPLYLLGLASTGRLDSDGNFLNDGDIMDHYRPGSKMFPKKLQTKIFLSTAGVVLMLGLLIKIGMDHGFLKVGLWYFGPYIWTNAWLVLYTWLQHTDPSVPQYGADQWTWVKGALTTIDRPYGIFDFFHHKIGSTHVVHHLFHEMPFYKSDEATAAIKAYLEPKGLYNYDPTPFWKAMWRIAKTCHYVEDIHGVQYYRSFEDVARGAANAKKAD
jgi:omega-6 fatty acid desaturase (delta-12 desaturase)